MIEIPDWVNELEKEGIVIDVNRQERSIIFSLSVWGKVRLSGDMDKRVLVDEEGYECPSVVYIKYSFLPESEQKKYGGRELTERLCRHVIEVLCGQSVERLLGRFKRVIFVNPVDYMVLFVWKA